MSTNLLETGTLTVVLDEQERGEILELLVTALGETRVEFHHTQTPAYRARVQQREAVLKRLIERFRKAGSS
jgi:hypothetical protein